ncbi:Fic family protein [Geotalea uraniireducens]|uniref:Filamentation induced by cAMP protein Fic n=1 Tax=Geotalea uraniireducens (strain Rf4) TaxID=351605 RepID=A5G8F4_GEOUR|nr:Fic/DOC family N-terminal domain-containing protein [Geotalea uraniireducens]ABQ28072.1 filamentation induced by cAMP protein Fic [Geotalea uraniireducens Rf4]
MQRTDLCPARRKLLVPAVGYSGAFALIPPPTPRGLELKGLRDELPRARAALDLLKDLSSRFPNPDLITRTADRREAVRSSQIEGTNSGVNDLLTYEATGSDEGLPPDVLVTLNYVRALEYGLQKVRQSGVPALTCNLIKELHAHLMDGVDYNGTPGEFRKRQNWIGGGNIYNARFVPPPPGNVQACMDNLELLLRYSAAEEDQMVLSVVIRMAIAHAQFETIHPFIDGNGRVGRILLPLMLAAEGYPPVYLAGYLKDNQREYYDALAGVQLREKWSEWVKFFAIGVEAAVQESIKTTIELENILKKWTGLVAGLGLRSHSVLYKFPELMIGTPVLTAHHAKDALGISFPAASAALAALEKMGILVQPVKHQRNRTFVAKEVIDVLNRPTGG